MISQIFVPDALQFNPDPAAHADVRRPEKRLRFCRHQHGLHARRGGYPHRDVPVMVMIIGEHREHLLPYEEGGLAETRLKSRVPNAAHYCFKSAVKTLNS